MIVVYGFFNTISESVRTSRKDSRYTRLVSHYRPSPEEGPAQEIKWWGASLFLLLDLSLTLGHTVLILAAVTPAWLGLLEPGGQHGDVALTCKHAILLGHLALEAPLSASRDDPLLDPIYSVVHSSRCPCNVGAGGALCGILSRMILALMSWNLTESTASWQVALFYDILW